MKTSALLAFAAVLSLAVTACPSPESEGDEAPPADGSGSPFGSGGADGEGAAEPPEAVLAACSGWGDAYAGRCGEALDADAGGGFCGIGLAYEQACEREFLAYFECITAAAVDCDDPDGIVTPPECYGLGGPLDECVDANANAP